MFHDFHLGEVFDELLLAIQALRDTRPAYMHALTPYAFAFVLKQIELVQKVLNCLKPQIAKEQLNFPVLLAELR